MHKSENHRHPVAYLGGRQWLAGNDSIPTLYKVGRIKWGQLSFFLV